MTTHSVSDQLRYVNQWFRTWSDYQKDDFLRDLASKLSPEDSLTTTAEVNGLVNGMQGLSTAGRPPTLFACQMKLFNDWWVSVWAKDDRTKFTEELKKTDAKFWEDLQNEMNGTRTKDFDDYFNVEDEQPVAPLEPSTLSTESAEKKSPPVPVQVEVTEDDKIAEDEATVTVENGVPEKEVEAGGGETGDEDKETFKTTIEISDNPADGEEPVPAKQND